MSTEYIRITYQCLGRTFDRLFKEQSLDETKNVVRRKLGLAYGAPIELAQLRDGRKIDLEDDDDFEAFKALTRTSLHAIVTVAIPENGSSAIPVVANAPGERKGRSKASHPVPCAQEAAQFGTAAPTTESRLQPSVMHATGAAPPRKKRKVAFNDDTVTSPDLQNPQQPTLKNARPSSSRAMPTTVVHESISGAAAMPLSEPTTSHPRSQAEKRSSSQIRMDETGKSKRKIAEITRSKRDPTESSAEASLKKRKMKCSASSRKHSSPEHEESRGDMSFDAPKKVSRKDQTVLPELPTVQYPLGYTHTIKPRQGRNKLEMPILKQAMLSPKRGR
ncbi:hypothetical protein F5148DRAFT_308386 [Russula earlei]|uniref:Uncharacterized protein n=1 Tax=Russula earlei TaxID=71964 RepID=A0ACC0U2D4_9AGAM|nr:hypothetical protein F5148DRAFT_308386 [Russula earlei]